MRTPKGANGTHTHTHTQFFTSLKLIVMLITFTIIAFACGKEDKGTLNTVELPTITRNSNCGPEGSNCDEPDTLTVTSYNVAFDCDITITMKVTRCYDDLGNEIFNFEDDGFDIEIEDSCPTTQLTDIIVQQAIDNFIRFYFLNNMTVLPSCGVSTIATSRQIKMDCTRLCLAPSRVGFVAYRYVSCSLDQGCCVQELEWCAQNGVPISSNEVNYASPSTCTPSTLNCSGDPIISGQLSVQPEPCGVRCDLNIQYLFGDFGLFFI